MASGIEFGKTLPYSYAARRYLEAGWSPLPLYPGPRKKKGIPPAGFTGAAGRMASEEDVARWLEVDGGRAVAIRLPQAVIGIDVDAYDQKRGAETLQRLEAELGRLPATWVSTARLDGVSGIRFFRVPSGLHFAADLGDGIEIICHGYRFARCWPSSHPNGGTYQWFSLSGSLADEYVPAVSELAELPSEWLRRCQEGSRGVDENDNGGWSHGDGYTHPDISRLRQHGIPAEAYHDNVLRDAVWRLVAQGLSDHEIWLAWSEIVASTPPKDLSDPFERADFERHLKGARKKVKPVELEPAFQRWLASLPRGSVPQGAEAVIAEAESAVAVASADDEVTEAQRVAQLAGLLMRRHPDGGINLTAMEEELPRSDMSAADLIQRLYPEVFTFSTNSRLWRAWDGTVHAKAEDGNVSYAVRLFARAYRLIMAEIREAEIGRLMAADENLTREEAREEYRRRWRQHRQYREDIWNQPRQARVVRQLEEHCSISEEKFDTETSVIVAENHVVIISANGIAEAAHDARRRVTKRLSAGVRYRPGATAPQFEHFLLTSVPDDDQRAWLRQVLGLALIGRPGKSFINLIGPTNSGKSTFIRALQRVLGSYAVSVSVETFLEGMGNTDFRLHELKGARFAFASEPAASRRLDTEVIKAVTGGDMQRTREPYGKFVDWRPSCAIVIGSNQPQRFDTSDVAMLNRIAPIEFSAPPQLDLEMDAKLATECDGILAWLIGGAAEALRAPASLPGSMKLKREMMAEEVDDCLRWVKEQVEDGNLRHSPETPHSQCILTGDAYQLFRTWCEGEGIRQPAGKKTFSQRVGRIFPVMRSNGSHFSGLIRLR